MAGFLRPRRGRRSTAESQAIILKRGEVFFECPDTGVGTGTGKIKVGDGTTAYADLPYFMDLSSVTTDVAGSAIAFTESTTTDNATLLSAISSGATLKTMISAIKKLLSNLDTSVTQLNNDLDSHTHTEYATINHTHSIYVTSDQVSTIVNENISSGEIEVSGSMFKSIETYSISNNTTGVTINGPGMVTILRATSNINYDYYGYLSIDGKSSIIPSSGSTYLFKSTCKIYCSTATTLIKIEATVGVFN